MRQDVWDLKVAADAGAVDQAALRAALAQARGSVFARDEAAPRAAASAFRHLAWQELAVRVPPEEEPGGQTMDEPSGGTEEGTAPAPPEAVPGVVTAEGPEVAPNPGEAAPETDVAEVAPPLAVPQISEAELQQMRDAAYAEGLSAGKAMTESERELELSAQFERLAAIIASLGAEDLLDRDALAGGIQRAVLTLASQRVGMVLDDMPEPMLARLEALMARLDHLTGLRELFVAPDDLALVQTAMEARGGAGGVQLRSDPGLRRGDARLRVGGAEIADLLTSENEAC